MVRYLLAGVLCTLAICTMRAQTGLSILPKGAEKDIELVTTVQMPAQDNERLLNQELERRGVGIAPMFATPIQVDIDVPTAATIEHFNNAKSLIRLIIQSDDAYSINLGFDRFFMPAGGELKLYSFEEDAWLGPFTAADNESHGELWTPVVAGDKIAIQVTVPTEKLSAVQLHLNYVNHDFANFAGDGPLSESGSCNVDVICPEGDGYRDIIRSVGVISTGGSTFCTGFLVSNTSGDGRPFFMTADHCGISPGAAPSLVVYWLYENTNCRVPGSAASGSSGNGSLSIFNTGSIFRADYGTSDMTLVELDDPINPSANAFLAGWNRAAAEAGPVIAIHHPQTDEKRISFENDPTSTTSYLGNSSPGNGSHIKVTDWDLGTTEPGSSGSPIYDLNSRVVGQLHGGYAACGNNSADWYGRFSVSWNGGGSSSNRLVDWLDPTGSGATVIDGMEADTTGPPPPPPSVCPNYCFASGGTADEWIDAVDIGPLSSSSGNNGGYVDFGLSANMEIGATYPLTIQPGWDGTLYNEWSRVWIDLNKDGDFDDAGELVFDQGAATNTTVTGTLTIPAGIDTGRTGLRVILRYNTAPSACGSFTWGEVEDYCITLVNAGGPSCPTPANPTTAVLSTSSATTSWDAVAGAAGYELNGRKQGTPVWRVVNVGGTSRTFNIFQASTGYEWRVRASCSGAFSGFSAIQMFTTPALRTDNALQVALHPNPANDLLEVNWAGSDQVILNIIDITGTRLMTVTASDGKAEIDVSLLSSGLYFLQSSDTDGQVSVDRFAVGR